MRDRQKRRTRSFATYREHHIWRGARRASEKRVRNSHSGWYKNRGHVTRCRMLAHIPMLLSRASATGLICLAFASVLACRAAAERFSVTRPEGERTYILRGAPPFRSLVFFLHGGGGHAEQFARSLPDLDTVARKHGWLVALPNGRYRQWNDGRADGFSRTQRENTDDVVFLEELARGLTTRHKIPAQRVFSTGISNGGFMSQRLACQSRAFRAVASVAANLSVDLSRQCQQSGVPVLYILGEADPLVPFEGGFVTVFRRRRGAVLSARESFAFFNKLNRCTAVQETPLPDTASDGMRSFLSRGTCELAAVELVRVENGGHTWPGGKRNLPSRLVGETTRDFSATERIAEFFERAAGPGPTTSGHAGGRRDLSVNATRIRLRL